MRIFLLTVILASLFVGMMGWKTVVPPVKPEKNRVLVVLDNLMIKDTHSLFFKDLEHDGFILEYKMAGQDSIKLQDFGEYLYDHMILFCTSERDPKTLKTEKILEFFDSGRNVIIAGDVDSSKYFRTLVTHFGVDFDAYGSKIFDHINNADPLDHSLIKTSNLVSPDGFHTVPKGKDVLYRGIGLSMTPYENHQVWGILRGGAYAYSRNDLSEQRKSNIAGSNIFLAAAVQGRNNARAIITGSLDMFSNELFVKSDETNRALAHDLALWTAQLRGALRVERIYHHYQGDASHQPHEYKIYDQITYNADITQYNLATGKWEPYVANDLQLEFVMLDPYIRMPLTYVNGTKTYRAEFQAPDRYGVFQFKVNYQKPGYTFLNLATKITVRPFKHNEYERYLFEAYPYYATVFATLIGFYVFLTFFLYDKDKKKDKKE